MDTVEAFGTGSAPVRLLIATEVASEGINLHHQCHHIIHYDLPWSIITLIQRNGRIDRIGQKCPPQLRYLMVHTDQGILKGDMAIFQRLIEKVEEINRLRQSGESVLQLYDPEAEEAYIANQGILANDPSVLNHQASEASPESAALEAMLGEASIAGNDEYLDFLLGTADTPIPESKPTASTSQGMTGRLRLFSDREFLLKGYAFLREKNPDYLPIEDHGGFSIGGDPLPERGIRCGAARPDRGTEPPFCPWGHGKLQEAVREAIYLLANEWVEDRRRRKLSMVSRRLKNEYLPGGNEEITAEDLRREALIFVYRLLFCFYAESRGGELGILPMSDEAYRYGYGLEALQDLELAPLTPSTEEGLYFQHHLKKHFGIIH